jgi:biopolymer transport protein ExbD
MRRPRSLDTEEPFSQINVTPFVDVMLVLLIIFMVLGPTLARQGFSVDTPRASELETLKAKKNEDLFLVIDEQGVLYLEGSKVSFQTLIQKAQKLQSQNKNLTVVITAHKNVKYNQVVEVMDRLRSQGISSFDLELDSVKDNK